MVRDTTTLITALKIESSVTAPYKKQIHKINPSLKEGGRV